METAGEVVMTDEMLTVQRRRLLWLLLSSGAFSVAERNPLQLPVVGALPVSLLVSVNKKESLYEHIAD